MAHILAVYRCSFCEKLPESDPIYNCANKHYYCFDCFQKLQQPSGGTGLEGGCLICKTNEFEKSHLSSEYFQRLRPGIGITHERPCSYYLNRLLFYNGEENISDVDETNQGDGSWIRTLQSTSSTLMSKRPLICLHDGCYKSVAISNLLTHFRHEHPTVFCYRVERGKELKMFFDLFSIEHARTFCLGIVTIYETNQINIVHSKSTQSVINTCDKLSRKVPLNTFWVMVSGSHDYRTDDKPYVILWIYSNCEERFWTTVELSSLNGRICVSSLCPVVGLSDGPTPQNVERNMNCLHLTHAFLTTLATQGDKMSLKVTIH